MGHGEGVRGALHTYSKFDGLLSREGDRAPTNKQLDPHLGKLVGLPTGKLVCPTQRLMGSAQGDGGPHGEDRIRRPGD